MKTKKKEKILVALSGGVDSSVAAALLLHSGYDVTAAYMVNYDGALPLPGELKENQSCWVPDYQDALRVAAKLGVPLLRLNFVKEYEAKVLNYMFSEYASGRTPNPDVMCNKFIKFGVWLEKIKSLGFEKIATGHYAQLKKKKNEYQLVQAKDDNKDQTYFLHQLNQEQLSQTLFPIGNYTKAEVRKLAKKFKLPTAEKEESMGICFVGEVPMKKFLQSKIKNNPGKIVFSDGREVGVHDGLAFYTIGQRMGIKGEKNEALYVVEKDLKNNKLIIGYENDPLLFKKEILVQELNWIAGHPPKFPLKCKVRLRHRQLLQNCLVEDAENSMVQVKFAQSERAVTPGQFAVFYTPNKICLGGGIVL